MISLTLQHAQRLSAALVPLYAAPRPEDLLAQLSDAVNGVMGAEMTCFDTFDEAGRMLNLGGNAPSLFTPEALRWLAEHVHTHPLFGPVFQARVPTPVKITDFCADRQFTRTDIFNDFYRPITVTHQLIVGFQVPGMGFATCALSRSRADFTETERALLAFVQPHLVALLQLAHAEPASRPALDAALGLTRREADVLYQLTLGRADKEIAHHCRISPRTVHQHLRSIYAKLGVDNRTAACLRAVAGH
ncbi:LuxR C-terminal-related transcriptional regulator [Hymenobacter sp. M29]|uniref:LuxR C-terminal-related transcriptional regulator n=1 Tax=Hymenobacter mellowenesis TaxID=3063995 RepID=A0ABT9AKA6_9BACT|nr:LuxR C-terminal-related transcriptional regulator [Hymenobacter sp. M29]MDO7849889.1 LuxR C-terminal-related transcriptional regulator [Hymenobacter sp. M29]